MCLLHTKPNQTKPNQLLYNVFKKFKDLLRRKRLAVQKETESFGSRGKKQAKAKTRRQPGGQQQQQQQQQQGAGEGAGEGEGGEEGEHDGYDRRFDDACARARCCRRSRSLAASARNLLVKVMMMSARSLARHD